MAKKGKNLSDDDKLPLSTYMHCQYGQLRTLTRQLNYFGHPLTNPLRVFDEPSAVALVQSCLIRLLRYLGPNESSPAELVEQLRTLFSSAETTQVERLGYRILAENNQLGQRIREKLQERASRILDQVAPWVKGRTILDCGAGDGRVGQGLEKMGNEVLLYDVVDYRDSGVTVPFVLGFQNSMTSVKGTFDTSLLLTVLHHCDDPGTILKETLNRTKSRVLIIESVFGVTAEDIPTESKYCDVETTLAFSALGFGPQLSFISFFDWFYNRVLHEDVSCPLNFNTPPDWRAWFASKGVSQVKEILLGVDQPLVPEYHVLYVLDK